MSWKFRFIRHELYNLKFIKVKQNPDEYWIFFYSIITVLLARTLLKAHHNLQHFAIGIVLASITRALTYVARCLVFVACVLVDASSHLKIVDIRDRM